MITFLAKLWIKDYQKTDLPEVRQAYGVLCGGVGIAFNLTFTLSETKTPAFPITMGSAEAFFCYALSL